MNDAHLHLALNHLPIIIPMVGLIILIGGFILRLEVVKRTSYFIFILGAIATIPAFTTGEGAEEMVEHLPEISHKIIHEHEEIAETFALFSYLLGFFALISLWASWKRKKIALILSFVTLILSAAVLFFAQQTGNSGGEIRHTEIRFDAKIEKQHLDRNSD